MLSGLVLILLGVAIYLHPRIIVAAIAATMIAAGFSMVLIHWRMRRVYKSWEQPARGWQRFIFRLK
ncbi:MAG: hypothetical protein HY594_01965 [Candidatus Omnitrophica bacterium]|nr:hypothetical protein [Candidatus Omnitrophota bacterium]